MNCTAVVIKRVLAKTFAALFIEGMEFSPFWQAPVVVLLFVGMPLDFASTHCSSGADAALPEGVEAVQCAVVAAGVAG